MNQSLLLQSLFKEPKNYESKILPLIFNKLFILFKIISLIKSNIIIKNSLLVKTFLRLPLKSILIFLFVISLPIAPNSNILLSTLPSSNFNTQIVSQRQFGVVLFSPSNLLLTFLFLLLIYEFYKGKIKFTFQRFEIFLLIFLITAEISVVISINQKASLVWLLKLFYGLIIYFIFSRLNLNKKDLKLIIYAILATIFLEGTLAFLQFLNRGLIDLPIESGSRIIVSRISYPLQGTLFFKTVGTLSHPNLLSSYVALLLPAIIIMILKSKSYIKIISYLTGIISFITIFLTLSRWGLITYLFACFFTFFLLYKYSNFSIKKTISRNKSIFLILSFLIIVLFSNPFIANRFLRFSFDDGSLKTRIELISQSIFSIKQNLQGIGGGTSTIYMANYDITSNEISNRFLFDVHVLYLLITTELGIFGLLIFMLFVFSFIRMFLYKIKKIEIQNRSAAIAFFSSFSVFLFNGLWEPRSFTDRVGFLFFFLLGLLINILNRIKS